MMSKKNHEFSILLCLIILFSLGGCSNSLLDNRTSQTIVPDQEVSSGDMQFAVAENLAEEMSEEVLDSNKITITVNGHILTATLADNESAENLKAYLAQEDLTVNLRDYGGFEKIGPIGIDLPTNNENITTNAGDFVLYSGNSLVIFYGSNNWSYTRLGRIDDTSAQELKEILGSGNVTVTLSLPE